MKNKDLATKSHKTYKYVHLSTPYTHVINTLLQGKTKNYIIAASCTHKQTNLRNVTKFIIEDTLLYPRQKKNK